MGLLETIGFLLGLAMLAGLNVYLTIFLVGLAVRMEWFHWAAQADALQAFGHPLLIAVALGLFLVEFGIDKIPWADSLWDSIHTFLRPAGGILLAVAALGPDAGTFWEVLVAILAGAAALVTHITKAGLRLNINTSPEPFSNIGASVVKDLAVFGGFFLLLRYPLTALFVFGTAFGVVVVLTPATVRSARAILWLIWKKLRVPAQKKDGEEEELPKKLHADELLLIGEELDIDAAEAVWAVPCVTGKTKGLKGFPKNTFGHLVNLKGEGRPICFVGRRRFRKFVHAIELADCHATHDSRFLSECLDIFSKAKKLHVVFRFHRGQDDLAERLAEALNHRIAAEAGSEADAPPADTATEPEEPEESDLAFPDEAVARSDDEKDDEKDDESGEDSEQLDTEAPDEEGEKSEADDGDDDAGEHGGPESDPGEQGGEDKEHR